jgi:thiosulfate/3-mercaptopyruvate sulfurtransferase
MRHMLSKTSRTGLIFLLLCVTIMLSACDSDGNSSAAETTEFEPELYSNSGLIISADQLADRLNDSDLRIVDLSPVSQWNEGRIPGAVHIWWQDTIEIHNDVYGMIADHNTRAELIENAGITEDSFVVVYDDSGGFHATRFIWLLHMVGFDQNVALLNGGRQAWEAAGYILSTADHEVPTGEIEQDINYDVLIGDGNGDVQHAIDDPSVSIIDGRSEDERVETWFGRLRSGQVPDSIHFPRDATVQEGNVPYFASPDELFAMLPDDLDPNGDQWLIAYGLHGVAASHTWFTLRLLGFDSVRLYDASWAEWGADPDRPIEELD